MAKRLKNIVCKSTRVDFQSKLSIVKMVSFILQRHYYTYPLIITWNRFTSCGKDVIKFSRNKVVFKWIYYPLFFFYFLCEEGNWITTMPQFSIFLLSYFLGIIVSFMARKLRATTIETLIKQNVGSIKSFRNRLSTRHQQK